MPNTEKKVSRKKHSKPAHQAAALKPAKAKPITNPEIKHHCTEPFYTLMQKVCELVDFYGHDGLMEMAEEIESIVLTSDEYAQYNTVTRSNTYYRLKHISEMLSLMTPAKEDVKVIAWKGDVSVIL